MGHRYRIFPIGLAALLLAAGSAKADFVNTGLVSGVTLMTFASGFPGVSGGVGPMGSVTSCANAACTSGSTLVTDFYNNTVYSFDSNTYTPGGSVSSPGVSTSADGSNVNYLGITSAFTAPADSAFGFGPTGGIFGVDEQTGNIDRLNPNGSSSGGVAGVFVPMSAIGGAETGGSSGGVTDNGDGITSVPLTLAHQDVYGCSTATGAPDTLCAGDILVLSRTGVYDIGPNRVSSRVVSTNGTGDGLAISPDGSMIYIADSNTITGYDSLTGTRTVSFTAGNCYGGSAGNYSTCLANADGVNVIETGALTGDLVVNTNGGYLDLVCINVGGSCTAADVAAGTVIPIATGGSRGDFVGTDQLANDVGAMFVSQSDRIDLLSFEASSGAPVPEPSSLALFATALLGLRWRRRRRA